MKISKQQIRKIVRESMLREFWGKKTEPPKSTSSTDPMQTASDEMSKVVSALWGQWDDPPNPELLKKAQKLHDEIKAVIQK